MRIRIRARRPAFSAIFKVCAVSILAYVLAVFCVAGFAALLGKLHVDQRLRPTDLVIGVLLGPTLIPIGFGFLFAAPAVIFWSLYSRFWKCAIVLHVDSLDDVEVVQAPNKSPEPTPTSVMPAAKQPSRRP